MTMIEQLNLFETVHTSISASLYHLRDFITSLLSLLLLGLHYDVSLDLAATYSGCASHYDGGFKHAAATL